MKLSTKEDLEAPAAFVCDELSDYEAFERELRQRGAQVSRRGGWSRAEPGVVWDVAFDWRGRHREVAITLDRSEPGVEQLFSGLSTGFEMTLRLSFVDLSPRRSRLGVEFEVRPRTLPSRILLQSAKLGKARLTRKFVTRVRTLAEELEQRHAAHRRAAQRGA